MKKILRGKIWRRLLGLAGGGILFFLGMAVLLVGDGLSDSIAKSDVALVLGNKVSAEGVPSPRLAARLDKAVELFEGGYFARVIVSGGTGVEGYPEGDAMRDYLVEKGVPTDVVIVDNLGINTRASARNAVGILESSGMESVFVITQYFHVPRSELALRQEGISEVSSAHADFFELRDFYSVAREVPAYVKYLVR